MFGLTKEEIYVLRKYYVKRKTQQEIAKMINKSESTVSRIIKKAVTKCTKFLK